MATHPLRVEAYENELEEHPLPPRVTLPTMDDLPDEEVGQPGLPDNYHIWQARLLDDTFRPPNYEPGEIFTASDMNLYYDVHDFTRNKRPDWFAVVGLPNRESPEIRRSYVIWQEGKLPLIVVELISPTTEKEDLGRTLRDISKPPTKWEVYERWLRVPYYLVFDRRTDHLRVFQLSANAYQQVEDHQNRLWIEEAELGIGLWQGRYLNLDRLWLRWYDREGNWLPTPVEQERAAVEQERVRAEQERVRAEQERIEKEAALRKAEQLAARLRELGIDPDPLSS
jgi:Uma2 family endonuclease